MLQVDPDYAIVKVCQLLSLFRACAEELSTIVKGALATAISDSCVADAGVLSLHQQAPAGRQRSPYPGAGLSANCKLRCMIPALSVRCLCSDCRQVGQNAFEFGAGCAERTAVRRQAAHRCAAAAAHRERLHVVHRRRPQHGPCRGKPKNRCSAPSCVCFLQLSSNRYRDDPLTSYAAHVPYPVQSISSAARIYALSRTMLQVQVAARRPAAVDENTKDVLRMVFSPRGSYVQELLVDELVRLSLVSQHPITIVDHVHLILQIEPSNPYAAGDAMPVRRLIT